MIPSGSRAFLGDGKGTASALNTVPNPCRKGHQRAENNWCLTCQRERRGESARIDNTHLFDMSAPREDWVEQAACAVDPRVDPNWFHPKRYSTDDRRDGYNLSQETISAKGVCAECPVKLDCLQYALKEGMWDGIYGGLTPHERRLLANPTGYRQEARRKWEDCQARGHKVKVDTQGYGRCVDCAREGARRRRQKDRELTGKERSRPYEQGTACKVCRHRKIRCIHIERESA